jgi:hypothetical protein
MKKSSVGEVGFALHGPRGLKKGESGRRKGQAFIIDIQPFSQPRFGGTASLFFNHGSHLKDTDGKKKKFSEVSF